jgi:hypothetical protein
MMFQTTMDCGKCGAQVRHGDRFCAKCGTPFQGDRRRHPAQASEQSPPRRQAFVPALETPAGREAFNAIVLLKRARAQRKRKSFFVTALVLAFAAAVVYLVSAEGNLLTVEITGGLAAFCLLASAVLGPADWTSGEYYLVPGSRDASGEHRCIHCGHRGIFRKGQYKSNEVEANCSKCSRNLWTEWK